MKNEICCVFNIGPHYRAPIFHLMDERLKCDFYFGDKVDTPIKVMDYNSLKGYKKTLKNIKIPMTGFEWLKGSWQLIFKPYKHYIITGTPGSLSNWLLAILALFAGKKVYAWTHGMKGNTKPFGKFVEKNFYRLCDKILLYGDFSKNIMIKEGFNTEKLIPIYNSLDYEKQLGIRETISKSNIYHDYFKNDHPILIYIGRIQKSKKLDLLVQALKKLKDKGINGNLVIIGQDVDGNDIPNLVEKLKLEKNVWFYGPCYEEEKIGELLFNSDVCITPGLIGLTAIHSLSYGTPVITSDNFSKHGPEFEAVKADVNGAFFKTDDLNDLCSKITDWINLDEIQREKVRIAAYKVIDEKFNPFFQVETLKTLISG